MYLTLGGLSSLNLAAISQETQKENGGSTDGQVLYKTVGEVAEEEEAGKSRAGRCKGWVICPSLAATPSKARGSAPNSFFQDVSRPLSASGLI